jgi:hypothetical protein
VFQAFEYQRPRVTRAERRTPMNWFMMVNVGRVRGMVPLALGTFQSHVGQGLRPKPPAMDVTAARLTLLGAIQVIQEKYDSAWKMYPGNQK